MHGSVTRKLYLRVGSLVVLILALALALITVSCSSEGSTSSSPQLLPNLHGQILFVRFGGKFGSETIFTASNGTLCAVSATTMPAAAPASPPMVPAS